MARGKGNLTKEQRVDLVNNLIAAFHKRNLKEFIQGVMDEPKIGEWNEADILQHWIDFQNSDEAVL